MIKRVLLPFGWLVPLVGVAPLSGCGVDPYLECGAPCDPDAAKGFAREAAGPEAHRDGGSAIEDGSVSRQDGSSGREGTFVNDAASGSIDARGLAPGDGGCPTCGGVACCGPSRQCANNATICCSVSGPCTSSSECCDNHFCDTAGTGMCVPCLKGGVACTSGNQCCSEVCVAGTSVCALGGN